jgi:pseudouridine-5'-phosphate glycosidase/pseudouridine kinase
MMLAPGSWQAKSRLAMAVPRVGMRSLRCWRSFSGSPYHDHQKASRKSDRSSVAGTKVAAEKLHGKGTSRHLWRSKLPDDSKVFQISNEVRSAVREDGPVIALETTIYTHGFPYPDNVSLALDLENIVRAHGAVPATIGILGGVAKIGLTSDEIKTLASGAGNPNTMKVSRRDLPYILGMVRGMLFFS